MRWEVTLENCRLNILHFCKTRLALRIKPTVPIEFGRSFKKPRIQHPHLPSSLWWLQLELQFAGSTLSYRYIIVYGIHTVAMRISITRGGCLYPSAPQCTHFRISPPPLHYDQATQFHAEPLDWTASRTPTSVPSPQTDPTPAFGRRPLRRKRSSCADRRQSAIRPVETTVRYRRAHSLLDNCWW